MKSLRALLPLLIMVSALCVTSCDKGGEVSSAPKQNKAVTYYTIDGIWQLAEWNGVPLADGTHLYLKLDRKEHRFEMWDNLNSMYTVMRSGSFMLSVDNMQRDVISGWYDYGVGDWANDYFVELNVEGDRMLWSAVDGNEQMTFVECETLPDFNKQ